MLGELERTYEYEQAPTEGQEAPEEGAEREEGERPTRTVRDLTPRELGMKGEDMAASYLVDRRNWEILARNWRCCFGEVDIVARGDDDDEEEGETAILVEVKTRLALGERADAMPELSVDAKKRRRYRNLALAYIVEHPEVDSVRFDVIALNVVDEDRARLRHLRGAFEWED